MVICAIVAVLALGSEPVTRCLVHPITRRALLGTAFAFSLPCRAAARDDSIFGRLRNRYLLLRPGETTFEAAGMVDSNPINKQQTERGLTPRGRAQVQAAAEAIDARGIGSEVKIFFDNGARATQTADIVANRLQIPRKDVDPEFRWLEARGLGELDGTDLREASARMQALDALDIDNSAEPSDDGTPSDSINEVFSRMRNTISKIESSYSGGTFIIIGGDATVLSVFAAAACGADLREHARFQLQPGEFFDLAELQRQVRAGEFEERKVSPPSDEEVRQGRAQLREMGSRMFSDTAAGSCLCCSCVR